MIEQSQVTAITFFHFPSENKWWAFSQMRRGPLVLSRQPGMVFSKLMGSGKGAGFSFWPDFSVYAMLTVFESVDAFHQFTASIMLQKYKLHTDQSFTILLRPLQVKGQWNGKQPFHLPEITPNTAIRAAITRASIRKSRLISFWKQVPATSRAIEVAEGRIFSAGIGEWPWIEQATISLWEDESALKKYAYDNKAHQNAIKETHRLNWYKEEMFARLEPLATIGKWKGKQLLEPYGVRSFLDVPPLAELRALTNT